MPTAATTPPPGYIAHNMELVGYHNLNQRPAFKLAMQVVRDRWYLYMGRFDGSGWNILDVTDPTRPDPVAQVDGPPHNRPESYFKASSPSRRSAGQIPADSAL